MRSELTDEEIYRPISSSDEVRILDANLFGEGNWSYSSQILKINRGVETYPLPLQDVFLCLNKELEFIYKSAESNSSEISVNSLLPIGNYVGSNQATCRANIDKLFGHHFAILGSTGSGKSCTVASILHSVLDCESRNFKPRIIMIDPHGEYASSFKNKAKVFRAYNDASVFDDDSELLKLPYWLLSSDEFRSLVIGKTEFEATSQNNAIYEGISYARLLENKMVRNVGDDPPGSIELCNEDGVDNEKILNFDRDKPKPFKLSEFEKHVDKVQGRKPNNTDNLAPSNKDRIMVESILKKLRILRANPQLKFIMDEFTDEAPKLDQILRQFIGDDSGKHVQIIDISGLPNEVAGPLTALISRLLFQYKLWQTTDERKKDPLLLICEEAHRYVPNQGEAQYKEAQVAVRRIAKEGRKYGLGLGLVS